MFRTERIGASFSGRLASVFESLRTESRSWVYCSCGASSMARVSPSSTRSPLRSTMMRSAIWATTARSWVM